VQLAAKVLIKRFENFIQVAKLLTEPVKKVPSFLDYEVA